MTVPEGFPGTPTLFQSILKQYGSSIDSRDLQDGYFTAGMATAYTLVDVLKSGSLPAPLKVDSESKVGPMLGRDLGTSAQVIQMLIDIVSKNGALLLNIGPRPDGTIPEPEQEILRGIGRWLKTNGEAIYGTRPWAVYGEGPTEVVGGSFNDTKRQAFTGQDIRFTTKPGALYAIALAPPEPRTRSRSQWPWISRPSTS